MPYFSSIASLFVLCLTFRQVLHFSSNAPLFVPPVPQFLSCALLSAQCFNFRPVPQFSYRVSLRLCLTFRPVRQFSSSASLFVQCLIFPPVPRGCHIMQEPARARHDQCIWVNACVPLTTNRQTFQRHDDFLRARHHDDPPPPSPWGWSSGATPSSHPPSPIPVMVHISLSTSVTFYCFYCLSRCAS